jgi:CheY-like chemotaxis protein/signal transduction histidine kinase/HAMP domain-containing protein
MKHISFKSIRGKLTSWFIILGLSPLLIGILITYNQQTALIKQQTYDKLVAIRDLKVQKLENWISEKEISMKMIADDKELRDLEQFYKKQTYNSSDKLIIKNMQRILLRYVENYNDFIELFIINKHSREVMVSSNVRNKGRDSTINSFLSITQFYIKNIYYSHLYNCPAMDFAIPIRCFQHKGKQIIGILVGRVRLEKSLYALLSNRIGLGKTGETLIVDHNVIALCELRTQKNAPLRYKINAVPAVRASQGQTGIIEAIAYDGEKVLAAYTYIPQTGWGFVAKQNTEELYAPIKSMMINFIMLIVIALALILMVAIFTAGTIAAPLVNMASTAEKAKQGDYSARNPVKGTDELATLAKTFNTMAEAIQSQMVLRQINNEITQTLVNAKDLSEFRINILKKLVDVTGSQMGAYFFHNMDTNHYEPFTSIGVSSDLLKPFDVSFLEGELGMVIEKRTITHIKDIPEDSIFKFKTFTGTILPKEIISIPIVYDNKVRGIVSVASIKAYPKTVHDIMKQPWTTALGTALSNMKAHEKTAKLAKDISQKNQELKNQSEEIQQASHELQKQNQALEQQRVRIEEANRLKSEFLSNMSHELRTPLNSVMALSRVLIMQAKNKLSDEEANYLKIIERNGKNLLSLINDILDLSKIEAGKLDIRPRWFSIKSTVEIIMERLELLATEKGLTLSLNIPEDLPKIESDESRVHQILQNLIGNAVKFNEKGAVTVSIHHDHDNIAIDIIDTGIGISQKDLPYIFEEFRQVDGSSSRRYDGTGLGLAIVYKTAMILGGNITVQSELGKGSTFRLNLPVTFRKDAPVSEPVIFRTSTPETPVEKTILIVDDEQEILTMISDHLSQDYNIITTTSGKEAIKLARIHQPFAITLDVIMPEMDGWEVLQQLRQIPDTRDIPVIIVSVSADKETGIALGAVGYVSKPIDRNQLIAEINRIDGPSPYSILITDDNEIDRNEIARTIKQENMKAIIADSGKKCLNIIKESLPDVLVLDLMMPEMDGFSVLNAIRSDPETRNLPVIVVTAKDLTAEDKQKLSGNVSSILAKSDTSSTALPEKIKHLLEGITHRTTGALSEIHINNETQTDAHKLLLVEDSEAAVIQVKSVLEDEGYLLDVVRNGQEALDYLTTTIPDGIILDLMMPVIDGFQVLQTIRNTQATSQIPVLVLTARDLTPEDLGRLTTNNIQQLIQKGDVDPQGLLFKIRLMLGSKPGPMPGSSPEFVSPEIQLIQKPKTDTIQKIEEQSPARKKLKTKGIPIILVVEDNPDNMITIKAILQSQYIIMEATDGETGLKMALTKEPDLILLDMSLPKMDGFTVVKKIKENNDAKHIPVIALTARAMKGDREMTIEAGCDDYISKPIDPEYITQKIMDWLGG